MSVECPCVAPKDNKEGEEEKGQNGRNERKFIICMFYRVKILICLFFLATERATRSKSIVYVKKWEEKMLKM